MFVRLPPWVRELLLLGALYLVYELGRMFSRDERSEERRVGKECRSRWSPYH